MRNKLIFRVNPLIHHLLIIFVLFSCSDKNVQEAPDLTEAQVAMLAGLEYLDQNQLTEAEQEFTRLIELAPNEVSGYANLGIVYMRQGNLETAEDYLLKALDIDSVNINVRLNLFELYQQLDRQDIATDELKKVLEYDPDNLFALYKLSETSQYDTKTPITALNEYLLRIIDLVPNNIVPRMYLIESFLEQEKTDEAREQFEDVRSKIERLPPECEELFNTAYTQLNDSGPEEAYPSLVMCHNRLKLTDWYQADLRALRGSEYSQVGIPLISFSRKMIGFGNDQSNLVYQSIKFLDVANNANLSIIPTLESIDQPFSSKMLLNDLDNDGDQDLLYVLTNTNAERSVFLFVNELGRFEEVIENSGLDGLSRIEFASFSDFDNDGFLDLVFICDGSIKLFRNINELQYEDVSEGSGLQDIKDGICTLSFDADHDGDLDIFIGTAGYDFLFQNNGRGVFMDVSQQSGINELSGATRDAVLGDFDDDGDIDFFIANDNGNRLYSNARSGRYENITASSGFPHQEASISVSASDYNNDGYLDLLLTDASKRPRLYANQGSAKFSPDNSFQNLELLSTVNALDHKFFDYDNDGFLDLVIASGNESNQDSGLVLLRNNQYRYEDVSWTFTQPIAPVTSFAIGDYNEDGDLDLFVGYNDGGIGLLRNDGGNMNYQLKVQLIGLREGSGKNNYYGIGSKVEARVGSLYQMRTVTSPNEYFGLGANERADILRIRWTNGVPQNIFAPHSDLDLIEQQKLKGSCPFLYTWDGNQFVFVKDMMWRSALGMPLGIMVSDNSRAYAYPDASREYLKVDGELLKAQKKELHLKITGELWETVYLDELVLFAVDHPADTDFLLDEKFILPPFPGLKLFPIEQKLIPLSVSDGQNELRDKVVKKDNVYISNFTKTQFQGITELTDLVIDLGDNISSDNLHLFLNGWIFPSDASINVAVGQNSELNVVPPYLQVLNEQGQWETVMDNIGFPLGKNKTMVLDLNNIFKSKDRKVRIRTSMQIYWDHIFYTYINEPFSGTMTPINSMKSNLQYRGFSKEFRKGGRNGPHWFDYNKTTKEPQWMDLEGMYTRYGDVTPLLKKADNQYIIYNAGDEVSVTYSIDNIPILPAGWKRDYVIYSVGWVKDGDLNTAFGETVEPLPFHGMSSYPYPDTEEYPFDKNASYLKEYNTRKVDSKAFQNALKDPSASYRNIGSQ